MSLCLRGFYAQQVCGCRADTNLQIVASYEANGPAASVKYKHLPGSLPAGIKILLAYLSNLCLYFNYSMFFCLQRVSPHY